MAAVSHVAGRIGGNLSDYRGSGRVMAYSGASHGRIQKTLWNVVFILTEMKSGRPATSRRKSGRAQPKAMACRTAR